MGCGSGCECVCACAWVCMWESEDRSQEVVLAFHLAFETGSLAVTMAAHSRRASPGIREQFSCRPPPLSLTGCDITDARYPIQLLHGSRN